MNTTKIWWFIRTKLTKWRYVSVGKHSYIGKPVYIQRRGIVIGNNVRIYPGLRAELTCNDAKIEIGDNVSIGQNFHVVCYTKSICIGSNTTISGNVFISNVDHAYKQLGVHVLEQERIYKETVIGENCFIGYGATILPGTVLGKQCVVGANSVVKGQFQDYCVIAGNPAKVLKQYNFSTGEWENRR